MKQRKLLIGLSVAPLVIVAGLVGGYFYLVASIKPVTKTTKGVAADTSLVKPTEPSTSSATTGKYPFEETAKSRIDKSERGRLMLITHTPDNHHYLEAFSDAMPASSLKPSSDWTVKEVGHDAMWIPGACAQKPSYILADGEVVIDDAKYDGIAAYHYYALYNPATQTFRSFGGTLANAQQQQENVTFINVENGKLVFYIDHQDPTGPYASSSSFKHSLVDNSAYLIRRVIDTPSLTYQDQRVAYSKPDFDGYHVEVRTVDHRVQLVVSADGKLRQIAGFMQGEATVNLSATSPKALADQVEADNSAPLAAGPVPQALGLTTDPKTSGTVPEILNYHVVRGQVYFTYNGAPAHLEGNSYTAAYVSEGFTPGGPFVMGEY